MSLFLYSFNVIFWLALTCSDNGFWQVRYFNPLARTTFVAIVSLAHVSLDASEPIKLRGTGAPKTSLKR